MDWKFHGSGRGADSLAAKIMQSVRSTKPVAILIFFQAAMAVESSEENLVCTRHQCTFGSECRVKFMGMERWLATVLCHY